MNMELATTVPYLTSDEWESLAMRDRALLLAAHDCDTLNVRETGENRGEVVEQYLRSAGLGPGFPWCAAFVNSCYRRAGARQSELPPHPASACNWREWSNSCGWLVMKPERGDLFGWCDKAKWRGHVGFVVTVRRVLGITWLTTIEGNTNEAGSREGTRLMRKKRMVTSKLWFARPEIIR